MTVETATISAALVPPKKREYSEYPDNRSPEPTEMDDHAEDLSTKSEPIKSSGFMITDILSPPVAAQGLRLGAFASTQHMVRIPSPHDTASSDAGSYKDNDISDDGEGNILQTSRDFKYRNPSSKNDHWNIKS